MKNPTIYALYKGEMFMDLGTADELAVKTGLKRQTIWWYSTATYHRRIEKRGSRNMVLTIKIGKANDKLD